MDSNNRFSSFNPRKLYFLLTNPNSRFYCWYFYTWFSCLILLNYWRLRSLHFRDNLGALWTISFFFLLVRFNIWSVWKPFLLSRVCCRTVSLLRQACWCRYWWKCSFLRRCISNRWILIVYLDCLSGRMKSIDIWLRRDMTLGIWLDILATNYLPRLNCDWIVITKRFWWHHECFKTALHRLVLRTQEVSHLSRFF